MRPPRRIVVMVLLLAVTAMTACAGRHTERPTDSAEALLPATAELVRSAVIKVLAEAGYSVNVEEDGRLLKTGYRQEIRGLWDWLVVYRFGTIRSWVEVIMAPETDAMRVKIDVYCEGKDSLVGTWRPYDTPLPQQAGTHLRDVQKTLDLL
jgi:hypothetical protein